MELEIETTIKTKVDIKLPYYCKTSCHAFVITNEHYSVCVCFGLESGLSIQKQHAKAAFAPGIVLEEITEQEFYELYNEVLDKLNGLF